MKIGITANPHIPSALDSAKHVVAQLEPAHEVVLESDLARVFGRNGMPLAHMKADVILAIGGDGTILRALQLSDSKVLGINSGSLGFLAEVYAEEVDGYLERIVRGDYKVEERMRLKVTVDGERMFDCTNEAVVHTAHVAKIRHFEIRLGEEMVERVRADGVIVATPTGSTSYSMSAGGPIVVPGVDAIVVTAICPHTLAVRPLVLPSTSSVLVEPIPPWTDDVLVSFDGQVGTVIKPGGRLLVRRGEHSVHLIRLGPEGFFARMRKKLQWGDLSDRERR